MLTPVRNRVEQHAPRHALADLPLAKPDPARIAVLLNGHPATVTDRVARRLERVIGADHIFRSRSLDEAEAYAREMLQRGYGTIVCGGGDGTLARAVNLVHRYVEEANAWRLERYRRFGERQPLLVSPRFASLRLGTGNGLSGVIGSRDPVKDLQTIVDFVPGRVQRLPLIEMEGERFFFGGMGYDSQVLDDYYWLKARAKNPIMKALMQNVTGYLATVVARTVPRLILGRADVLEARVVNRGRAFFVDPRRGDFVEEVEPGAVLFEGRAHFISAGTTPFFGYGFRVFPFARMMPGMMSLRAATVGPLAALSHLPSLWKGNYRNATRLHDFLVEDVTVELERPFPYQHSGDPQGLRDRMDLRIADEQLEIVDLYGPGRPVY